MGIPSRYNHGCRRFNRYTVLLLKNFGCNLQGVIIPERLADLMRARGLSQSELGRQVGVTQQTIYKLLSGASRGSSHLHKIARALETTPAYLTGEIDDPDKGAPPAPPAPTYQFVIMPVALPSEDALAQMFEGLLDAIGPKEVPAVLARELAQLLPTALPRALRHPIVAPLVPHSGVDATRASVGHEQQ